MIDNSKMEKYKEQILKILLKPFDVEFRFFILVLILSASADIVGFTCYESFLKAIFIGFHHYFICYIVTLFICYMPKVFKNKVKFLVFVLMIINFLIDTVCVYSFHFTFDNDVAAILLGTNRNEVHEFIENFIPLKLFLYIILFMSIIYVLYEVLKRKKVKLKSEFQYYGLSVVFICLASFLVGGCKNFGNVSITKIPTFFKSLSPIDLENYKINPNVIFTKTEKPKNIVMIIGESFSKSHSSLYGYEKKTNPYLESLRDEGLLYTFENVTSAALGTITSFKAIMSTYKDEYGDSINWYECLTIQELIKKAGYYTYWISNQSPKGVYDNIVVKYASLCDKVVFTGNKFAGIRKCDLDEIVIDSIRKYNTYTNNINNKFYFIHLMGSHSIFSYRYPLKFNKFKDNDYVNKKIEQRTMLATYDNSVLYNDSVVYEIMKLYENDESIVFYFPDHGLDIYNSREDYIGHARYNDKISREAGANIPFMVYMSPLFQKKFVNCKSEILQLKDKEFNTSDMIYMIKDIIGVKIVN